jgi:hypothetical protein
MEENIKSEVDNEDRSIFETIKNVAVSREDWISLSKPTMLVAINLRAWKVEAQRLRVRTVKLNNKVVKYFTHLSQEKKGKENVNTTSQPITQQEKKQQ